MPRKRNTKGIWAWKAPGGEWQDFPRESSFVLERTYTIDPLHIGTVNCAIHNFGPFIEKGKYEYPLDNIQADFIENILVIRQPPTRVSLKRMETFDVPPDRGAIDVECGVPSLPLFPHPFTTGSYPSKKITPYPTFFYYHNYGVGDPPMTIKEQLMNEFSTQIRETKDWERKYRDHESTKKWRSEARLIDDDMFRYVIDELDYYLSLEEGAIKPSTVDGVWQADNLIQEFLHEQLLREAAKLEAGEKDWQLGTGKQVLNLVHPSLFCFVAGVTRQTSSPAHPPFVHIGSGEVLTHDLRYTPYMTKLAQDIKSTEYSNKNHTYSSINEKHDDGSHSTESSNHTTKRARRELLGFADLQQKKVDLAMQVLSRGTNTSHTYQFLPAEFGVDKSGQVSVLSYINNLDPRFHQPLYHAITKILEALVPLYEHVLTDLANPRPRRYAPEKDSWEEGVSNSDLFTVLDLPSLPPFTIPVPPENPISLKGRRLQVIVKLTNIVLTPDKPTYPGAIWCVEGMQNEQIVSTAVYYYDSENISEAKVNFRAGISEPNYERLGVFGVVKVYGLEEDSPLNQKLGSVSAKKRRCIIFPNLYQHQLAPFSLKDPSKPGHLKMLTFLLVDPSVYVMSSLWVPPQQPKWLYNSLVQFRPFSALPPHILTMIVDYAVPMTRKQAEKHREVMMEERAYFERDINMKLFERIGAH